MEPLYRLEAVGKRYGEKEVLAIPALEIREGSFHFLTGPNGSGKTTLLSILAFLLRPTSGALYYAGRRVEWKGETLVALRREVTLLHQSPYLFDGTVFSNVAYGLKVRGIDGEAGKERIDKALKMVGLEGFGGRRARALSGGEMQRVALARALVLAPRALLLDEPLANVDRESVEVIRDVIAGLPARGTTVIMATHDTERAGGQNGELIRLEEGSPVRRPRAGSGKNGEERKQDRMIPFEEARNRILARVAPLGGERVPIFEAAGRVLAEEVRAPGDMPPWDNSAMDGYAVRSADCAGPAALKLTGYRAAGDAADPKVTPGCAVKIMTGSPIPEGCDAVVPFEETEESGGFVRICAGVKPRAHIRFRGEDVKTGDRIIPTGTVLRPPEISMLASFGKAFVPVYRKARVALLSTGDELVELGEPLSPGKIVNSNTVSLAAAIEEAGAVPVLLGIAVDDKECLREKIREGLAADALVTSAGVSAGDRDFVREVLSELSVEEVFWKVDIKPGRPTAFGMKDGKPVFSLPGNPVSSLVTFEVFVRPALRKMMGHPEPQKRLVKAVLKEPVRKKAGRTHFLRVRIAVEEGEYAAWTSGDQNTGILRTMVLANGIAVLSAERTDFKAGEKIDVCLLYQSATPK